MTVEYSQMLSTVTSSGLFKILIRWRGSFYKLLWKDFLLFVGLFYAIRYFYNLFDPIERERFEMVVKYCKKFTGLIPVNLVLMFYVGQVVSRFNQQFSSLPWLTRTSISLTTYLPGRDEESRMMRRSIVRYLCLSYVLTMTSICRPVKKRFPTFKHLIDAGILTENELKVFEGINTVYNKWFVPIVWATGIVDKARRDGKIKENIYSCTILDEMCDVMIQMRNLFLYDWVCLPLVYTQVVTLVVYSYFIACLVGYQDVGDSSSELPVPVILFLLFFFYMGWLKVAEELLNPFGEDDDDLDINALIDFNLEMGYLIVDELNDQQPGISKDLHWDDVSATIPYTTAAQRWRASPFLGTTTDLLLQQMHTKQHTDKVKKGSQKGASELKKGDSELKKESPDVDQASNKNSNSNSHGDFFVHVAEDLLEDSYSESEISQQAVLSPSSDLSLELDDEEWHDMERQDAVARHVLGEWDQP